MTTYLKEPKQKPKIGKPKALDKAPARRRIPEREISNAVIENELVPQNPENWLMLIEKPRLHMALSKLRPEELELLYMLTEKRYKQTELAGF